MIGVPIMVLGTTEEDIGAHQQRLWGAPKHDIGGTPNMILNYIKQDFEAHQNNIGTAKIYWGTLTKIFAYPRMLVGYTKVNVNGTNPLGKQRG